MAHDFTRGDLVVNLTSQIATVVRIHHLGDPVLRAVRRDLKPWGGAWLADPAKTRKLTAAEVAQFQAGGTEIIR